MKRKTKFVPNQLELSKVLGVNRDTIRDWRNDFPNAPKAKSDSREDVEAWREFIKINGLKDINSEEYRNVKQLRMQKLKAEIERIELENEIEKSGLARKEEFLYCLQKWSEPLINFIDSIPRSYATRLHPDPVHAETILKEIRDKLREIMANPMALKDGQHSVINS